MSRRRSNRVRNSKAVPALPAPVTIIEGNHCPRFLLTFFLLSLQFWGLGFWKIRLICSKVWDFMYDYIEILILLVLHFIICFFKADIEEDEYETHRSCWKHVAYLNTRDSKPKLTKEEFEMFKLNAPCLYEECTRRERSRRRVTCKYLVSKLRKKLNSNVFMNYLE